MSKSQKSEFKVAILGGGISGLVTGYYLKKQFPELDFTIFEKKSKVGGVLETLNDNGNIYELGARGIRPFGKGKVAVDFLEEIGMTNKIMLADGKIKGRYIYLNKKLEKFPDNISSLLFSKATKGISKAFVTDILIQKNNKQKKDESISSFLDRHFGSKLKEILFDPIISGTWAGNMDHLSIQQSFPRLVELEKQHGSLLFSLFKSRFKSKQSDSPYQMADIISFKGGMSDFVNELADQLCPHVQLSSSIDSLSRHGNKVILEQQGSKSDFDMVISTIPAYALSDLLIDFPVGLTRGLSNIEYAPVAIVPIGYKNKVNNFKGYGYLVPHKEQQNILGVYWNDLAFTSHGQQKGSTFTVLLGGTKYKNFHDYKEEDLINQAVDDLSKHMGIKEKPNFTHCKILKKALPQYNLGHGENIKWIQDLAPQNLMIKGNFIGGVGMSDIIRNAKQTINEFSNIYIERNKNIEESSTRSFHHFAKPNTQNNIGEQRQ